MASGLDFMGPYGGTIAIAFGAGCAAGWGFCVRTIYKMLSNHADEDHRKCMERITFLEEELSRREQRIVVLEERWMHGTDRQMDQLRLSGLRVIGEDKLGGPVE